MATFPCDKKSLCFDPANPFLNTTAEAPDAELFLGFNTGYGPSYPPLGGDWTAAGCTAICQSTVSQQDADLCAANNWAGCIAGVWPPYTPLPAILDRFGNPVPNPAPRPIYSSNAQTVTVSCPDGNPFVYTLPAGKFSGFSQAMADAEALSFAQQTAANFMVCLGVLSTVQCCSGVFYDGTITATGAQLTDSTVCWDIFGELPPGIVSDLDSLPDGDCKTGSLTLNLLGTPTVPGVYTFAVKVSDALGDFMVKNFTLTVIGITTATFPNATVGTAYSQNVDSAGVTNPIYSLENGSFLPTGLTLDPSGVISGTPTTPGVVQFTLGVTEAGTGMTCTREEQIEVDAPTFWDLIWDNPPDVNTGDPGTIVNFSFTPTSSTLQLQSTSAGLLNTNSNSLMNYAGPNVNCNLHVVLTCPPPGGGFQTTAIYQVKQDGVALFTYLSHTSQTTDVPFTIAATAGSTIEVLAELTTNLNTSLSTFTCTLSTV